LAMGTAVGLAVLLGLWIVVLMPFVRDSRHAVAGLRSIDHFHAAMRILSRREDRDRRWVTLPPGARAGRAGRPVANSAPPARPVRTAAQRRARTFGILVATVLVSTCLAVLKPTAVWLVVAVFSWVALGAAMAVLRASAKAAAQARAQRRRVPQQTSQVAPAWSPATGPFAVMAPTAAALARMPRPAAAPDFSQTMPVLAPPASPATVTAQDVSPDEWREWTDEPFAGVRVLDLTTPGGWRRRRLFESEETVPEPVESDEVPIRSRRTG
jgi:hypothetical protein